MDLNLVQIVFDVETENTDAVESFMYQALRRFDVLFRQSCCRFGSKICLECNEQSVCPYQNIFAQELSTDLDIVRRHQKPPLPYAFKISHMHDKKSCLEISLVVIGNAVNHLYLFDVAVRKMIELIPEKLSGTIPVITGTYCIDYQSGRHELDFSLHGTQNMVVLSSLEIMENTTGSGNVRLILESPLRIISTGFVLHSMDFGAFFRSQLRRCSSLFAYYGDGELDVDYVVLSAAANQVNCLKNGIRFLQPSWSQRPNCAGLLGIAECEHVVQGILPLLNLGSFINAGKGASFGLGAYSAEAV